jgi:hypothetical protein
MNNIRNSLDELDVLGQDRLRRINIKNQSIREFRDKIKKICVPKFKIEINGQKYLFDIEDLHIWDKESNVYKRVLSAPLPYREIIYDDLEKLVEYVKGLL